MTREEYNEKLAVKIENTEGFTQKQIDWINDYIFDEVSNEHADDEIVWGYTRQLFQKAEIAMEAYDNAGLVK